MPPHENRLRTRCQAGGLAVVFSLLVCLSLDCASRNPAPVGAIRGRAVDQYGNALPGITVTLESDEGKPVQTVTTGEGGSYEFPAVPVGRYRIVSLFAGYSTPRPVEVTVSAGGMALPPPLVLVSPDSTE